MSKYHSKIMDSVFFGALNSYKEKELLEAIDKLISEGYIEKNGDPYRPLIYLSKTGRGKLIKQKLK